MLLFELIPLVCLLLVVQCRQFITYAALGDSYASGNGAGSPQLGSGLGIHCGRFDRAYPIQVSQKLTLAFSNLACAGSFISTVLKTQAPWIGDSDVVSVQVGGNEADFFSLLNECVQQWRPISTCEKEVAKAKSILESASFIQRFDSLISGIQEHAKPDATILVLGYARFFNDKTDQCSHISFSRTNPDNLLTKDMRQMFNHLMTMLNSVIKAASETRGALYVDIDEAFEGHRFCENGVIEPAPDASWFFNDMNAHEHAPSDSDANQAVLIGSWDGFLNLTRTFHPTIQGHTAIASQIVELLHKL